MHTCIHAYTHTLNSSGILLNVGKPCRNSYNTTHNQFNYSPTIPLNHSATYPLNHPATNHSATNPLNHPATNYSATNPLNHSAPKLLPPNHCIPLGPPGRCPGGRGDRSSPTFAT